MADNNTAVLEGTGRGEAAAARLAAIKASSVQAGLMKAPDLAKGVAVETVKERPAGLANVDSGQLDKVMAALKGAVRGGDGASAPSLQDAMQKGGQQASWQNYVNGTGPAPGKGGGGRTPGG